MSDDRSYDEPLPWLQGVEDEQEPRGISARRMLAALLVVLAAALIVTATFFWLGRRDAAEGGPPELIQAPPGPYKIKPPNPGGLDISGESQTAFATSAGEDTDAKIDLNAMAEEPLAKPPPPAKAPPAAVPGAAKPVTPPLAAPKPAAGGSGSVVQLGAFQNPAQAERAWTALSARFPTVAAMTKLVVPFPGGTRLRASAATPADAKAVCQALKAAGENCFVAQ